MRHDLSQEGDAFRLRPVALEDSAFIVALRTDPSLSRFVHTTAADPAAQRAWIERYFERAGDYYFIIENQHTKTPEGTISIYDLDPQHKTAEWGRWILRAGSLAAVESVMHLYRIAFEHLGLDSVYCRTLVENEKVVSFHTSCGLKTTGVLTGAFNMDGQPRDAVEQRLSRSEWPAVEARLAPLAARTARLVARERRP